MKEIGFQNDTLFMNKVTLQNNILMTEEFEDTKGAISIRISKKNRQHNDHDSKQSFNIINKSVDISCSAHDTFLE